eukprot:5313393-Alexandrium_andersonii.AAC.1
MCSRSRSDYRAAVDACTAYTRPRHCVQERVCNRASCGFLQLPRGASLLEFLAGAVEFYATLPGHC